MKHGEVVRGLRSGLVGGGVCALGWGAVRTVGVMVALVLGHWHEVSLALDSEVILVADSLFVGAVLGLPGVMSALAPGWLTSHRLLHGPLAALVADPLFLGEVVVSMQGGFPPVLLMVLSIPVVGAVAAACSGDIAGRTAITPGCGRARFRGLMSEHAPGAGGSVPLSRCSGMTLTSRPHPKPSQTTPATPLVESREPEDPAGQEAADRRDDVVRRTHLWEQ